MMTGNNSALDVFLGEQLIATLSFEQDQLLWHYQSDWQQNGFAISPSLPLHEDIPSINVNRFLRNLLPEGHAFDELLQAVHVSRSNTFALVRALGLDTPGALVMRQSGDGPPKQGVFRKLEEQELIMRLEQRDIMPLTIWDGKPRLSVAGVQDKINVVKNTRGELGFGEGSLCSTHIIKFERRAQANLVLNGYLTMKLAKCCGINVVNAQIQAYGKNTALVIERFDRKLVSNDNVKRRHMMDGCQALNLAPEYKYERNFGSGRDVAHIRDGANLPLIFNFANQCQNPALTKQLILDWLLFNLLTFNFDAHAKNISFFVGKNGITLTPFYDLVNIKMYPDVEQEFAMALGDEFASENIHAYQLADFAETCQLPRSYLIKRLQRMIKLLMSVLSKEIEAMIASHSEEVYFKTYQAFVTEQCHHLLEQTKELMTVTL